MFAFASTVSFGCVGYSELALQRQNFERVWLQVCKEAARAAWPAIAGTPGKPEPELAQRSDSARGEQALYALRVSSKLRDVGPEQLATSEGLREGVQRMLGGEATTPGLQAAVRPGCVHLVVDALTFKVRYLLIRPPDGSMWQ